MKVDNITRQYEIPGFDIAPQALEEEDADDLEGAPYSRDPGIMSAPSTGGWQQLLGLTQSSPTPTTIDPPTRQILKMGRLGATASFAMVKSRIDSGGRQSGAVAPKVTRMVQLLAHRQEAIARIRIRAAEGGQ